MRKSLIYNECGKPYVNKLLTNCVGYVGAMLAIGVDQSANAAGRIESRFLLFVGYVVIKKTIRYICFYVVLYSYTIYRRAAAISKPRQIANK